MNILSRAVLGGVLSIFCLAGVSQLNDSNKHKNGMKQETEYSDMQGIEARFRANPFRKIWDGIALAEHDVDSNINRESIKSFIAHAAGQAVNTLEGTLEHLFIEPFKIECEPSAGLGEMSKVNAEVEPCGNYMEKLEKDIEF